MQDISVIILTLNEELHIRRCIESAQRIAKDIYIVDSFSTDATHQIAEDMGVIFRQNPFKNQANQFNWALDNLPIKTEWVLRLDADEYLSNGLVNELELILPRIGNEFSNFIFPLGRYFLNKKLRPTGIEMVRMFRYGKARCEERWMDEHLELQDGEAYTLKYPFYDHNLNNIGWWTHKHNNYSIREAIELLDIELELLKKDTKGHYITPQAAAKRKKKESYARKPLFLRSFIYFIYRYFFKLGFLDGKEGFLWCFLQGWWYRTLVDAKIFEIKKECGNDVEKIKLYIKINYNIEL